jgi:hypothetical protein
MTGNGCLLKFSRQTGPTFEMRFEEHIPAMKANRQNSMYDQRMIGTGHTYSYAIP